MTQQQQIMLKPDQVRRNALVLRLNASTLSATTTLMHDTTLLPTHKFALAKDPLAAKLMKDLDEKKSHSHFLPIGECLIQDGLLYYQSLLYIPDDAKIKLAILR